MPWRAMRRAGCAVWQGRKDSPSTTSSRRSCNPSCSFSVAATARPATTRGTVPRAQLWNGVDNTARAGTDFPSELLMDDVGFIQALLAAPEDLTLRLVYADWLEERGDPRGEYLRCQC